MLVVDYYSDVLCVWAWIAQRRIEELDEQFDGQIQIRHRFIDVFGNVPEKISRQWGGRGSYLGFAEHVRAAAEQFEEAPVSLDIWQTVRPNTSANAHLFIKAVELFAGTGVAADYATLVRRAFFVEQRDVGHFEVLQELLVCSSLFPAAIDRLVCDGSAMAALMSDYQQAKALSLKGSPSYVMNEDRQILYGNVGYRVLSANVEELLKKVGHEASWC